MSRQYFTSGRLGCGAPRIVVSGKRRFVAKIPFAKTPSLLIWVVGMVLIVACGNRTRTPERSTSPLVPGDASADADVSSTNVEQTRDSDSSVESAAPEASVADSGVAKDVDADTPTSAPPVTSTSDVESEVTVDAGVAEGNCAPLRCTCPDPASPDCCHEWLPYRNEVLATVEELADNAAGMVDPNELPQVPTTITVSKEDLWDDFVTGCGVNSGCHVGSDRGPNDPGVFQVTFETFNARANLGVESLERIKGIGGTAMPIGAGDDPTKRECTNRWVRLGETLAAYERSGWQNEFQVPRCPEEIAADEQEREETAGSASACGVKPHPYALTQDVALSQTNIGQCIPTHVPSCPDEDLQAKDDAFAGYKTIEDFPTSLRGTDLVSLDSEVLARHRVYSYSPTYTLFSDNAKKQRYVRVPVGQKITYNAAKQDFDIPDNTRFYKTFLKPVLTKEGVTRYRKIETRLIIARSSVVVNGMPEVRALRATYAWDQDEKEAKLVTDQRKDGQPWADRLCPVIVNENGTRDEEAHPVVTSNRQECHYVTQEQLEDPSSGLVRHYAIPGSQRCDECHMGANNRSYILGFSPWAADHRPAGEGGIYDTPHQDELSQLQRLLDYGVVQGIAPGQAKLEDSQGAKRPRTDYELKAQAYMVGNCAYCHNPNGFPSVQNPILKELSFYPQKDGSGGIFQFPLDKTSPRVRTGTDQRGEVPYITTKWGPGEIESSSSLKNDAENKFLTSVQQDWLDGGWPEYNVEEESLQLVAPWRSVIWRNVYTPFTYTDNSAMYIHMPRNVPGFDCRAHGIMADWMLGIPVNEAGEDLPLGEDFRADLNAEVRVEMYHAGLTGQHCPTDDDILDPAVLQHLRSAPTDTGDLNSPRILPAADRTYFRDLVPDHTHWVAVDFSTPTDRWEPKRPDWRDVLLGRVPAGSEELATVIQDINTLYLTSQQEDFSLEKIPMGLWAEQCKDKVPVDLKVSAGELIATVTPDNRWVKNGPFVASPIEPNRDVHSMSRGQAVFELICQNCHGVNYDSKSPLATTVGELSGGGAIVANFRAGLFGPELSPGAFADAEFTFAEGNTGGSAEDWQARYLLFMGLGGTQATIPRPVLDLISSSPFYGQAATVGEQQSDATAGANMLQPAQEKCNQLLKVPVKVSLTSASPVFFEPVQDFGTAAPPFAKNTGHYQLWEAVCGYGQAPLVRVLAYEPGAGLFQQVTATNTGIYYSVDNLGRELYPAEALVGDPLGQVVAGIQPQNRLPWCVRANADDKQRILADLDGAKTEDQIPWCPEELLSTVQGVRINEVPSNVVQGLQDAERRVKWARKGAINAGVAAFYYMDRRSKGLHTPVPGWNSQNCGTPASAPPTETP